jgi:hypothetical protein
MWCPPEKQHWVLQPLVDAGLALDEIRTLVFQLAFDDLVGEGRITVTGIHAVVRDQPPHVRAAWAQMLGRMLTLSDA